MSESTLLFLSASDVRKALPMAEAVALMKQTFIQLSRNEVIMPPRVHIESAPHEGNTLFMPASLPAQNRMGIKVVSLFNHNAQLGLPRLQALMLLLDGTTGSPLAIMDGTALTALRTGAASGAATDLLAAETADTVAILGAGVQGRTQLEAVCAVRTIRQAWVYDPDAEAAENFCWEMGRALRIPVKATKRPGEALHEARVVCTASTSPVPVFADRELKSGVHINAVGSYRPSVQEVPSETVARATIVVDHRASALTEAGDLILPRQQHLIAEKDIRELGEIAAGDRPGRTSASEVTLFKSVGVAVQDVASAAYIYEQAEQFSLGTEVTF